MGFRKILIIFPIVMLSISFSGCIVEDIGDSDQNDIQDNHVISGGRLDGDRLKNCLMQRG